MWVNYTRRSDLDRFSAAYLHQNYYLCADHFEESQFMNVAIPKSGLKWNALPTLFDVPHPPPKIEGKRQQPKPRQPLPSTSKHKTGTHHV